jgi:Zn-dependent protease
MFGKSIHLLKVGGIPIRVDLSWFFIAVLIAWSLAGGLFPRFVPGQTVETYWLMGIAGAVLLFVCIVLHPNGSMAPSSAASSPATPVPKTTATAGLPPRSA